MQYMEETKQREAEELERDALAQSVALQSEMPEAEHNLPSAFEGVRGDHSQCVDQENIAPLANSSDPWSCLPTSRFSDGKRTGPFSSDAAQATSPADSSSNMVLLTVPHVVVSPAELPSAISDDDADDAVDDTVTAQVTKPFSRSPLPPAADFALAASVTSKTKPFPESISLVAELSAEPASQASLTVSQDQEYSSTFTDVDLASQHSFQESGVESANVAVVPAVTSQERPWSQVGPFSGNTPLGVLFKNPSATADSPPAVSISTAAWTCSQCTYINETSQESCEVCESGRVIEMFATMSLSPPAANDAPTAAALAASTASQGAVSAALPTPSVAQPGNHSVFPATSEEMPAIPPGSPSDDDFPSWVTKQLVDKKVELAKATALSDLLCAAGIDSLEVMASMEEEDFNTQSLQEIGITSEAFGALAVGLRSKLRLVHREAKRIIG